MNMRFFLKKKNLKRFMEREEKKEKKSGMHLWKKREKKIRRIKLQRDPSF